MEKELDDKVLNKKIEEMLKEKKKLGKKVEENADEKIFRMIQPFLEK